MNKLQKQFKDGCFDNQSKYPSLEKLLPRKTYVITINPNQSDFDEIRLLQCYNRLKEIVDLTHGYIKVYTEISTKSQNVHYHGFIRWLTYERIGQFYLNINKIKDKCQFEIDYYNDPDQWWPYISKQNPHLDAICKLYKLPNKIKMKHQKIK